MQLSSKLLQQIAFNTRPKIEENMLIVMNKSTHEEHLSQPLQTNNKQFKIAVTFPTGYNGTFNVTHDNNKSHFKNNVDEGNFIQVTISEGAYELESLKEEIRWIIIDKDQYSENNYPFTIKPNFSTLGSIVQTSHQGPIISFVFDDSITNVLGFDETIIYRKYNLSPNPVSILSLDNIFLDCDIAKVMVFRGKRSGIIHNWTMTVDPVCKYVEKFIGGTSWYINESKDVISSISFRLKIENGNLVLFNGQSISFRVSIKEI